MGQLDISERRIHQFCMIITTSANALIEPIHNRMPVILSEDAEKVWLNKNADIATLKGMLNPIRRN